MQTPIEPFTTREANLSLDRDEIASTPSASRNDRNMDDCRNTFLNQKAQFFMQPGFVKY
jgi:hypothetical protein